MLALPSNDDQTAWYEHLHESHSGLRLSARADLSTYPDPIADLARDKLLQSVRGYLCGGARWRRCQPAKTESP